ncbi:hypothetical protein [Collinsella sp. An2]|uniref:hypothetical protein n=1 Tax=Collinsella sp. An2 TaxID=1965585 RepID=UPI000B39FFE4|nr:hypothetical protein [Collinsella sp. An2]OUP09465.1 hypothetical protein B5F33_04670 [Collinsella sp. An2]
MFIYVFAPLMALVVVAFIPAVVLGVVSRRDRRAAWLERRAAEEAAEAAAAEAAAPEAATEAPARA